MQGQGDEGTGPTPEEDEETVLQPGELTKKEEVAYSFREVFFCIELSEAEGVMGDVGVKQP